MNRKVIMVAPLVLAGLVLSAAAQNRKELKYNVGPGASVTVINEFGQVTVKPSTGRQVLVTATPHSDKVEVDTDQAGNRINLSSHILERTTDDDAKIDYEISLPSDAGLTVRASNGPVAIEGLRGEVSVISDGAQVEIKNLSGGHLRVQTVSGPVTLSSVSNEYIDVVTISGDVKLTAVTGPKVSVNSTRGNLSYDGDFGNFGSYTLANHSGNVEITMPQSASVEVSARSVSGSVENDFPLQKKVHSSFVPQPGRSFIGTANSASSSVELRTFSGTIRVKKQ